jgi:hypothetical protein
MSDSNVSLKEVVVSPSTVPPRRGRPPKSVVESKKKPGKVGRPVGTQGRIEEFKARLLGTTGTKVIDTVLRKALDDEDRDQVACLKMCIDRMLPMSMFEKNAAGSRNAVTINITGIGETKIEAVETIDTEVEITDVEYEEKNN